MHHIVKTTNIRLIIDVFADLAHFWDTRGFNLYYMQSIEKHAVGSQSGGREFNPLSLDL